MKQSKNQSLCHKNLRTAPCVQWMDLPEMHWKVSGQETTSLQPSVQKTLSEEIATFFVLPGITDQAAQWKTPDGWNLDLVYIILHFHTNIPMGLEDQKYQQSVTKCQLKNA